MIKGVLLLNVNNTVICLLRRYTRFCGAAGGAAAGRL